MIAAPVLFGVDVVNVDRVARAVAYSGPSYGNHLTAPEEHPLHDDPTLATAASVAVKECLVKAVGGKPAGFTWHDFHALGDRPDAAWALPLLDAAVPELAASTDVVLDRFSAYAVRGASRRAGLARFAPDDPTGATDLAAAARWGWRGDLIVAIAIMIHLPEGSR